MWSFFHLHLHICKQVARKKHHRLATKSCPNLLRSHGWQSAMVLCPRDFPDKNTRVGCHFLLQGIFPTQGLNPCLLHWQADSLPLSHQESPVGTQYRARSIILLWDFRSCLQNTNIHR